MLQVGNNRNVLNGWNGILLFFSVGMMVFLQIF